MNNEIELPRDYIVIKSSYSTIIQQMILLYCLLCIGFLGFRQEVLPVDV